MSSQDEFPTDAQRIARVSEMYEAQTHQNGIGKAAVELLPRATPEVPCKLAPAVLRRSAARRP